MARLCERPGCSQPAEALYGLSAEQLTVWLEPYDVALATRVGVLCRRHADAMVVPLGWMLEDRREPVPRLFKTREVVSDKPLKPKRRKHRLPGDETGQLELLVGAVAVAEAAAAAPEELAAAQLTEPPVAADDAPVAPWKPVFDQRSDLDGLLDVRSPLLSRAFRGHSKET